jgi:uncharacterized protein (TIGR02300 family)
MVKPEWGAKRVCHSCGASFYDLHRDPITCPKCGAVYDPEAILKSRRARPAVAEEKEVEAPEVEEAEVVEAEEVETPEGEEIEAAEGEEEEDKELIEDASELGEDEDDMAEVIDNIDDEER